MLHEIKIDKNFHDGNLEKDVMKKIQREKFFGEFQDSKIKMGYLIKTHKTNLKGKEKFNFFLKIVKQIHNISIIDSLLFLEEDYPIKVMKEILSSENTHVLKMEFRERFNKKKDVDAFPLDEYFV